MPAQNSFGTYHLSHRTRIIATLVLVVVVVVVVELVRWRFQFLKCPWLLTQHWKLWRQSRTPKNMCTFLHRAFLNKNRIKHLENSPKQIGQSVLQRQNFPCVCFLAPTFPALHPELSPSFVWVFSMVAVTASDHGNGISPGKNKVTKRKDANFKILPPDSKNLSGIGLSVKT